MELSIDLHYLSQISFNDKNIMNEMLQEWISDTFNRIEEFKSNVNSENTKIKFNIIHTLKTNYFMIGCQPLIKLCEEFLNSEMDEVTSLALLNELKLSLPFLLTKITNSSK
ncbi:MAG: hypothetical protein HOP11_06810 [Saprospiraceae bacterium]|nr:hypothetical protein [Saprospiraceae bacterium]